MTCSLRVCSPRTPVRLYDQMDWPCVYETEARRSYLTRRFVAAECQMESVGVVVGSCWPSQLNSINCSNYIATVRATLRALNRTPDGRSCSIRVGGGRTLAYGRRQRVRVSTRRAVLTATLRPRLRTPCGTAVTCWERWRFNIQRLLRHQIHHVRLDMCIPELLLLGREGFILFTLRVLPVLDEMERRILHEGLQLWGRISIEKLIPLALGLTECAVREILELGLAKRLKHHEVSVGIPRLKHAHLIQLQDRRAFRGLRLRKHRVVVHADIHAPCEV